MKWVWTLRALAVLLFCVVAARPVTIRPDAGLPSRWAVLIDDSLSMRIKDPEERLATASRLAASLGKKASELSFFRFSEGAPAPIDPRDLSSLKPTGRKTDLAGALTSLFAKNDYRGAVVFTDGRQVGAGDAVSAAAGAGRPLLLVGMGDRSRFRDVAVRAIQGPPFAFKNVATSLSATLSVVGYPGQKLTVRLREGDQVLGLQTVQVSGPDVETTVSFTFTPHTLGTKVLTVECGPYEGEATAANNRKEITLDVGRDRFRVLYICGEPGPEYAFLRHQFKSDPAVELVTFVILRNAGNVLNIPDQELSLIPFPTQDALINQIASFDLIVFEEFAYQAYGLMPGVMYAVRQKVQDGGSFLLTGGPVAFGPGSPYAIPGVKEMIPVELGNPATALATQPLKIEPTIASHPILRLEDNPDRNKEIWSHLAPLEAVTLVPGARPGATVVASAKVGDVRYPVLTAWKFGKGRVAALTTRTTWRWAMLAGDVGATDVYQRFWKNMVLWLTHADQFKSVRAAFDSRQLKLGEPDLLRVWVYDEYFKPLENAEVRAQVRYPDGKSTELTLNPETAGVYSAPFKSDQLGTLDVQAWAAKDGKRVGEDRVSVRVVESESEEEDLRPDFEMLKELAHASGGRFVTADSFSPEVFKGFREELATKVGTKVLIWNSPWFLVGLLLLFVSEWAIRKRKGLP